MKSNALKTNKVIKKKGGTPDNKSEISPSLLKDYLVNYLNLSSIERFYKKNISISRLFKDPSLDEHTKQSVLELAISEFLTTKNSVKNEKAFIQNCKDELKTIHLYKHGDLKDENRIKITDCLAKKVKCIETYILNEIKVLTESTFKEHIKNIIIEWCKNFNNKLLLRLENPLIDYNLLGSQSEIAQRDQVQGRNFNDTSSSIVKPRRSTVKVSRFGKPNI